MVVGKIFILQHFDHNWRLPECDRNWRLPECHHNVAMYKFRQLLWPIVPFIESESKKGHEPEWTNPKSSTGIAWIAHKPLATTTKPPLAGCRVFDWSITSLIPYSFLYLLRTKQQRCKLVWCAQKIHVNGSLTSDWLISSMSNPHQFSIAGSKQKSFQSQTEKSNEPCPPENLSNPHQFSITNREKQWTMSPWKSV